MIYADPVPRVTVFVSTASLSLVPRANTKTCISSNITAGWSFVQHLGLCKHCYARESKPRRNACVCHFLQRSNSKGHSQGKGFWLVIPGTYTGLWHPAHVAALACSYNCTSTVPYQWVHAWKSMYSCVNVAMHLWKENTTLFPCGKHNYKILISSGCIVKNTTESCSFGRTGSWEHILWQQPGLVGKACLWVRRLMLYFPLFSLFVVTLYTSHFTDLFLFLGVYSEGNHSTTNSGIFCHVCRNDNLCFTRCLCFWK